MTGVSLAGLKAIEPLGWLAAAPAGTGRAVRRTARPRVAVVGAGAFGGWTALHLVRRGARVTLFDAWGPGNSRASSGGETRIIRATYGPDRIYVDMVARSLRMWREFQERAKRTLFRKTGVLWLAGQDDQYERAALPLLREAGLAVEELTRAETAARYPQIHLERVSWAIHEKDAGYLLARRACQTVLETFQAEGGDYRTGSATPGWVPWLSRKAARSPPTPTFSRADPGSGVCFPRSSAIASGRRGRKCSSSAPRRAIGASRRRCCRSGSTRASASSTAFRAMNGGGSRWATTPAAPRSIRRPVSGLRLSRRCGRRATTWGSGSRPSRTPLSWKPASASTKTLRTRGSSSIAIHRQPMPGSPAAARGTASSTVPPSASASPTWCSV